MPAIKFESGVVLAVKDGYGFIRRDEAKPGEKNTFFLLSDGCGVAIESDGADLVPAPHGRGFAETPRRGQHVAFVLCEGPRGHKARPWMHEAEFEAAKEHIAAMPVYRLVQTKQFNGSVVRRPPVARTVWQGRNISDLVRRCPVDLGPRTAYSHRITHEFFVLRGGEWVVCGDPRVSAVPAARAA